MRKGQHINIVIEQQGEPSVTFGQVWIAYKRMVAIEIDLNTKYCVLDGEARSDAVRKYVFNDFNLSQINTEFSGPIQPPA